MSQMHKSRSTTAVAAIGWTAMLVMGAVVACAFLEILGLSPVVIFG